MDRFLCSALLLALLSPALAVEPAQRPLEASRFVGATNCSSSSCHGGAGEKRSQFITWQERDFHTRGYAILTNARSQRIADTLALPSAQTSARCTTCHAPFQTIPAAQRLPTVQPQESVSCESCHGAAGTWLRGHTRPDWTYPTRVGAGLRDLKSLYVRANTCVACHQNIDTDLTAAGHPDLLFELHRQSIDQPKHWRDPAGTAPRAWLIGQAVALRETSWKLVGNSTANDQTLAQWQALAWLLAKVTAADSSLPPIEPPASEDPAFAPTQKQADALARRVSQGNLDPAFLRRLRLVLAATGPEFKPGPGTPRPALFHRAQRLILALEALDFEDGALKRQTDQLRQDVRTPTSFDPAQFAAHLEKIRKP